MTDFGIARSLDVQHGMTQTGTVLGTSDYIAPEQAQGQRVDEQTDVYSLGVVLYELLTNEVPFPGENFVAVAMRHINEEPPSIRDKRPDVLAAASRPRFSVRWRRTPPTASRRWPPSARSSRRVSPRRRARRSRPAVRPQRSRAGGSRRRGISPWPLILRARGAARDRRSRRVPRSFTAPARTRPRRRPAARPPATAVTCAPSRPTTRSGPGGEHDAERRASHRRQPVDLLDDRGLPRRAAAREAGRRARARREQAGASCASSGSRRARRASPRSSAPATRPRTATRRDLVARRPSTTARRSRFSGGTYRYYVVWITRLGGGYHKAQLNEVKAS